MSVGKSSLLRAAGIQTEQRRSERPEDPGAMQSGGCRAEQPGVQRILQPAGSAAAEQREPDQQIWAAVVPRAQLREIPDEWRGPRYVRPNISQLAESISRCGILEPLPVVQTAPGEYQLVGGSKRMEVVRMLGIEEVPVVVLPGSSAEDARQLYLELRPFTDAAQDTVHNAKFRTAALFGAQRIPEYLL